MCPLYSTSTVEWGISTGVCGKMTSLAEPPNLFDDSVHHGSNYWQHVAQCLPTARWRTHADIGGGGASWVRAEDTMERGEEVGDHVSLHWEQLGYPRLHQVLG